MSNQDAIPEYRLMVESFIAPHHLLPGSRIQTTAKPNEGWAPLNAAAEAALDAWYDEEYPAYDEKFKPIVGPDGKQVMIQPHTKFRPLSNGQAYRPESHHIQVLAIPDPKAGVNAQGLAESLFGRRPDTDPRPGPAVPTDFSREIELPQDFTGTTAVLEATPRPKRTA